MEPGIVVSTLNSSSTPLGANEIFYGTSEQADFYHEIFVTLSGLPGNAPGTLFLEYSLDGIDWDISVPKNLNGPEVFPQYLKVTLPYFRVRYENGATPLTQFNLVTTFHRSAAKETGAVLDSVDIADRANRILGQIDIPDVSTETTLALIKEKTDNLDVALSTRAITGLTDAELRASPLEIPFGAATDAGLAAIYSRQADGSAHTIVDNTVPVTGTFYQATQPVSAVSLPLPSGASTEATLSLIKAKTDNLDVALSTRAITGLTDTQLRASAVPVSGTVTVNLGLTDAQLRATPVPVSGTFYQATQPVSLAVAPVTPVTGTFWQTTQPVSGPLTNTELRAVAVPVSGTFYQSVQPVSGTFWQAVQPVSGTFFQATQPVSVASLPLPAGASTEATLSSIDGKLPALISGRIPVDTEPHPNTSVRTTVAMTTATSTLLAANANRKGAVIYHEGAGILYIALGPSATITNYTRQLTAVSGDRMYEIPFGWTGIITATRDSGTSNARITELT